MNGEIPRGSRALLMAAAIAAAPALGLAHLFGPLPAAGLALFFLASLLFMLQKKLYHLFVLTGIWLLFCVFAEPAPSDMLLCAAVPLGLVTGLFKPRLHGKALWGTVLFAVYFIACLPGIALADDQAGALRYYLVTLYLFLMALFFCAYTREGMCSLLRAYLGAAFLSFLAGLAGILGVFPEQLMADAFRVKGLFKDPNVFGPFFVPAILLIMDDIKRKALLKAHTAVHAVLIALLSLGVIFSFSRGAWINLLAAVFIYILLSGKLFHLLKPRRFIPLAAAFFLAAGLIFSPSMSDTGIPKFLLERAQLQQYDTERFNTQQGGLQLVLSYPLGVGPGQFENKIAGITKFRLSAHSLYIRTAAENGVAGFLFLIAALLFLLLSLLFDHLKTRKNTALPPPSIPIPSPAALSPAAPFMPSPCAGGQSVQSRTGVSPALVIAVLCGLLVSSIAVDTIHWRHFWLFIGVGLSCLNKTEQEVLP